MNGLISTMKMLYRSNKLLFIIALIAIMVFVVGCSSGSSGYAPPSGPIGGGCG